MSGMCCAYAGRDVAATDARNSRPASRTIVIVEDDAGMRSALSRVLELAGYHVESYSCAEDCLSAGAAARADGLVCDLHLPGASGFELIRRLARAGVPPPFICITAHDTPAARAEAAALGAADFLAKPFDGRSLISIVKRLTGSA